MSDTNSTTEQEPVVLALPALHAEERFQCPHCERNYRHKGDLKEHVLRVHKDDAFARTISRTQTTKEGKPFVCPLVSCKSGYKYERDLQQHCKKKHTPLPKKPALNQNLVVRGNNLFEWQAF